MNPITLRQTFQTANLEALREAQGFNDLQAREAAQKKVLDDRTSLEQNNVPGIPRAEAMRTEERKGRQRQPGEEKPGQEGPGGESRPEGSDPANPAETRLDFLA